MKIDEDPSADWATAALLLDLWKAFEQIRHDNLLRLAQKLSFPLWLLKLQLDIYTKTRALALDGAVSDLVYVPQTVLAGGSFATAFMKLQLIEGVDRMQQA
eukprot:3613458-Pyramimonas_sp.AAC.1